MINYTCSCNRLHLIKSCLCCFLAIHKYSNSLSSITTISFSIISEIFRACFSCSDNVNPLHISSRSDDKKTVFETPEAESLKPGHLSIFIRVLSLVLGRSVAFISKCISFAKSYINFIIR